MLISGELLLVDQSLEGFPNQFFSWADIAKDVFFENKESTIDPNIGLVHVLNLLDIVLSIQCHNMIAQARLDTDETADFVLFEKMIELSGKRKIRQAVAIVGEEHLFPVQIFFYCFQPLPYVGSESGVCKCNSPIADIRIQQVETFPPLGKHKIIRYALFVVQEVFLDDIGGMTEAQYKILMSEMGIVLHHMP